MSNYQYSTGAPGLSGMVRILLFITVGIYLLQLLPTVGEAVTQIFGLDPNAVLHGQIWRLLSYGFLHDTQSPFHILLNMLGLWMFGTAVEARWGPKRFLSFYLFCIVVSGLISLLYLFFGYSPLIIGASGGLLGVLTLYAIFYPDHQLLLFFIIPVKARLATIIFAVISLGGAISGRGGVAHLTHLGGIAAAFIFLKVEPHFYRLRNKDIQRTKKKRKEPIVHYYEPRKSRQEIEAEKADVDRVLSKISKEGMEALTESEYKILERASGKSVPRK